MSGEGEHQSVDHAFQAEADRRAPAQLPAEPRETDLDFVCNEWVLGEKQSRFGLPGGQPLRLASAAVFWTVIFLLMPLVPLIATLVVIASGSSAPEVLAGACFNGVLSYIVLTGAAIWAMPLFLRFNFPTNLTLEPGGIRLHWRDKKQFRSRAIPWEAIKFLTVDQSPHRKGSWLLLDFDTTAMRRLERWLLILQTSSLWAGTLPRRKDSKLVRLQFPLDSLTLDADRFRLIAALRARVDQLAITKEFMEMLESNKAPTFTQLWLDDMQSFRRNRTEELPAGAMLQDGRYEIQTKIATGGQAKIYAAFDHAGNRQVAVKELILPVNAGADVRNRAFINVKNEAMLLGALDHPGVVKLLDNFVEDHRAYVVLEHIDGKTLRRLVQEKGALAAEDVIKISRQIAFILSYLHGLTPPLVHRDLTPDNFMLTGDFQVRLLDFNVAQQLESNTTRTVVGKHNYMAPEQFRGKPCTQSDLYSFGATLYFLLTGEDPLPLASAHPGNRVAIDQKLDQIVARLTAIDLSERYGSVSEVRDDLESLPVAV